MLENGLKGDKIVREDVHFFNTPGRNGDSANLIMLRGSVLSNFKVSTPIIGSRGNSCFGGYISC